MYRIIFGFFFVSGFSSLVFETLWERMLQTVFGSTQFALSTLLTAFMTGLALGSWLAGKIADETERPLRIYGLLEGGIGLYAFVVPFALDILPTVYDYLFDAFLNDFYLFSLLRFGAAFLILVIPTTMMGATLPLVSQWVSRHQRLFQGSIGMLYGVNTFGACAGTMLAGFVMMPALGMSMTNTTFAMVNLFLCGAVLAAEPYLNSLEPGTSDPYANIDDELDDEDVEALGMTSTTQAETSEPIPGWLIKVVLGAFAVSGAVSMVYQVLWTRAYVIILGSSTYSFTLILTAFLIGLGSGSAVISPFLKKIRRPVFWIAVVQFGVATAATAAFFTLDKLPTWMFYRFQGEISSIWSVYFFYFLLVGLVVLIPTLLQGMTFPLVVRAVVQRRERSGEQVGDAYAFNTAGSIVGSFAGGFILLPFVGLHTSMTLIIVVNVGLAAVLGALELREVASPKRIGAVACALLVAVGALLASPPIDKAELTRGMFRVYWARELYSPEQFEADDPEIVYYEDGLTSTVTVEKRENVGEVGNELYTLKANGKPEASDGDDMSTQIMVGLLPYVVRSGFEDVEIGDESSAMVGYGSGVTAGAALQWPLSSLECIEIEPAMVEASKYFNHVNHKPLQDDRMQIIESDGRNYLEYTDHTYDVIVSEPSNPWIAGVASLFTVDHFQHVKAHLAEDGVFAQWVQLYEMRPKNVRTILNTFLEVFPHVHGFSSQPKGTDLILIASKKPIPLPPKGYERAWSIDSVRNELQRAGVQHLHDLYGLTFMTERELREFAEGAPLNTDNNGLLEYEAPKDLIRYKKGTEFFARKYFEQDIYGDLRPYLDTWPSGDVWTPELVGKWGRGMWLSGKPALAEEMLSDAGLIGFENVPGPFMRPYGPLESLTLVRHAQSLDLSEGLLRTWPIEDSKYRRLLAETLDGERFVQATQSMEANETPDYDGYSGERGLLYAYFLYEEKYYPFAERQIERLRDEDNPRIVDSFAFQILDGAIQWERRHYGKAWEAYLKAGISRL